MWLVVVVMCSKFVACWLWMIRSFISQSNTCYIIITTCTPIIISSHVAIGPFSLWSIHPPHLILVIGPFSWSIRPIWLLDHSVHDLFIPSSYWPFGLWFINSIWLLDYPVYGKSITSGYWTIQSWSFDPIWLLTIQSMIYPSHLVIGPFSLWSFHPI